MLEENEIEISISVRMNAGIGFKIDRAEWEGFTDDQKRQRLDEAITMVANKVGEDITYYDRTFLSADIIGPNLNEIDLADIQIYDSKE
jgi:hypothetical protein